MDGGLVAMTPPIVITPPSPRFQPWQAAGLFQHVLVVPWRLLNCDSVCVIVDVIGVKTRLHNKSKNAIIV